VLVYIAVPSTGWIRQELAECLRQISHDTRYQLLFPEANPLTRPSPCARHWIINGFLDCGADYLLMMDSDAVPYTNPLDLVELDLDVVAMACPIWRPGAVPPIVLNARPLDDSKKVIDSRSDGPLLEVAQVSTSVILVARRCWRWRRSRPASSWWRGGCWSIPTCTTRSPLSTTRMA
jgi:hypothetical protein